MSVEEEGMEVDDIWLYGIFDGIVFDNVDL